MTQGEPSFLSVVVDPHNIRLQHFLMLRWVLLRDYCSCFYIFRRPLKFVGLSMPAKSLILPTGVIAYFSEYCSPSELSSALINMPLRALQSSSPTHHFSYCLTHFLSYMTRAWGMPASFVHNLFFTPCERLGTTGSPLPPMGHS
jgi:hypothetical protein